MIEEELSYSDIEPYSLIANDNYWGNTKLSDIHLRIHDGNDDLSITRKLSIQSILSKPDILTPVIN